MFSDYVINGAGHGPVGSQLAGVRYDPGLLRPYIDKRGERCVTALTGRMIQNTQTGEYEAERRTMKVADLMARGVFSPVFNATTLRKEEWIEVDRVVVRAARSRLRAWADLMAVSRYGGFNAMSKLTLEYEAMSDPGEAVVDMDALTPSRNDQPVFSLRSIPLPITHADFRISARRLATSRNSGTPLDTTLMEGGGRRVGEMIEQTLIGTQTGVSFGTVSSGPTAHVGTSAVYGYTNFPYRIVKINVRAPSGGSWSPDQTVADVIAMRESLYTAKHYGPFMLYTSTDWDAYLDNDYYKTTTSGAVAPTRTLRDRIRAIEGIQDIRRLDYLTNIFTLLLVEMDPMTIRAIDGMGITTVQWETSGGLEIHFKVMAIQVPQLRYDQNGNTGIVHATTA